MLYIIFYVLSAPDQKHGVQNNDTHSKFASPVSEGLKQDDFLWYS